MIYIKDRLTTGDILIKYREALGINQKELAKEFNVSAQYISQLERNEKNFSEDMQEKYYSKFQITLNEKEAIAFYEDFRVTKFRTKAHILELEEENAAMKKQINKSKKGDEVIECLKKIALKDYLED